MPARPAPAYNLLHLVKIWKILSSNSVRLWRDDAAPGPGIAGEQGLKEKILNDQEVLPPRPRFGRRRRRKDPRDGREPVVEVKPDEPSSKEIFINCHPFENRVAIMEDGKLEYFYLERKGKASQVGNIYQGRVTNILPGLEAAFVDIGVGKDGFLPFPDWFEASGKEDKEKNQDQDHPPASGTSAPSRTLAKGQEILVQVVKEPIGGKGPRLTTQISLPGRFLVLLPFDRQSGVSRKIVDPGERDRLRSLLDDLKVPPQVGVIIRTAALAAAKKVLQRDLKYLLDTWKRIDKKAARSSAPALVHEELSLVIKSIRDLLLTDVERIVVDDREEYKRIDKFLGQVLPSARSKLELYKEKTPLFEKYGQEKEIHKIFQPRIYLKCGGTIVFNQTEALVTVDVNAGRLKKRDQEQTALTANLEAAEEIARQLRLRNVGGIIVIDFIDLEFKKNQQKVMSVLLREMEKDKAKSKILPMSELGLVQMTRQREQESYLYQVFETCPYCAGQGLIKSRESISLEIKRRLIGAAVEHSGTKRFRIEAHPLLYRTLLQDDWPDLCRIGRDQDVKLSLLENPSFQFQEYVIWALADSGPKQI